MVWEWVCCVGAGVSTVQGMGLLWRDGVYGAGMGLLCWGGCVYYVSMDMSSLTLSLQIISPNVLNLAR